MMLSIEMLSGCSSKGEQWKQEALTALEHFTEVSTYHTQGSGVIDFSDQENGSNHDTVNTLFRQAHLTWQGITDVNAQHTEMNVGLSLTKSGLSLQIPIILTSNTLYFNLPSWVAEEAPGLAISLPETSQNTMYERWLTTLISQIITPIEAKFFNVSTEDEFRQITIEITNNNILSLLNNIQPHLDQWFDSFQEAGLITAEQADLWRSQLQTDDMLENMKTIHLPEDGYMTFIVDENLQLHGYAFKLAYQFGEDADTYHHLAWTNRFTAHNEEVSFTQSIPENPISLDDILERAFSTEENK